MTAPEWLGLDVGGTGCAAVVGGADGVVCDRRTWPSAAERGPDAMIADLVAAGRALVATRPCRGIGVAIGGPLDPSAGVVLGPPNLPGWDHVPLAARLADALELPVRVEHDAVACALAEWRWGAGRDARSLVYLTCGTGFGAGFVVDGRPLRGSGGHPSDLGHVRLSDDGPVGYGIAGSAEGWCAAAALGRIAAWRFPGRWSTAPEPAAIAGLAAAGDADAAAVVALHAQRVGQVCALLADIWYPERILLGSAARYLGPSWLEQVRAAFVARVHPDAARLVEVAAAGLGAELQERSALAAAMADDDGR